MLAFSLVQLSFPVLLFYFQVCSDFQRGRCLYTADTCPFAHPQAHCPLDADGLVTVCVDYVKGKCIRETCKYFHPPEHLVAQLKAVKAQSAAAAAQVFSNTAAAIQYSSPTIQLVHPVTLNSSRPILAASPTTYAYPQQTSTAPASSSPLVCLKPLARFHCCFYFLHFDFFNL